MEREIIFKGISMTQNRWVFGSLVQYDGMSYIISKEGKGKITPQFEGRSMYPVYPESVSEFVGLTDSHNNYIYEHDLMKINYFPDEPDSQVICQVAYDCGAWTLVYPSGYVGILEMYDCSRGYVIGNAYDELLCLK